MTTNKDRYQLLCEQQPLPLFLQHWWMEAVCAGKEWDVCLVFGQKGAKKFSLEEHEGDQVVGAMPYLIRHRLGFRFVLQPQLTQYNGPWYNYAFLPEGYSESQRMEFEKKVADKLLLHLQRLNLHYFQQNFAPQVTNWLPYHWWGYSQTTRYTYRLEDLSDLEAVFARFDRHHRASKIRRAEELLSVDPTMTPAQFEAYHQAYWSRKGKGDVLPTGLISRVAQAAVERGQGAILAVRDKATSQLMGARFVSWDASCAYSLLSALTMGSHPNGTSPMLFWECLKVAVEHGAKAFDFEGSMDMNIEQSYRLYGALQTPYHQIYKSNSPLFLGLLRMKERREKKRLTKRVRQAHASNPKPQHHR